MFKKSLACALLALLCLACSEQKEADTSALTRPLPESPSPTPDPRVTDLNRVVASSTAPDFELEDVNGKLVRLSDSRGKKAVVLVFYRGYF